MLSVRNINQFYGGSHILRDVTLEAQVGKVTVLLGRNGAGKSTLLKALMGLVPIRTGSIEFEGRSITHATPYERARAGIGFVPQGREIFARLTVEENLRMGLAYKSASAPIPAELFELFPVLKQMMGRRGGDLSGGGQQQQLAIARALAAQHHQRHRAGHSQPRIAWHERTASCYPFGRTVLRLRRRTGGRLSGDGARSIHRTRAGWRDGGARRPQASRVVTRCRQLPTIVRLAARQ